MFQKSKNRENENLIATISIIKQQQKTNKAKTTKEHGADFTGPDKTSSYQKHSSYCNRPGAK
jgi:hypothetical protein